MDSKLDSSWAPDNVWLPLSRKDTGPFSSRTKNSLLREGILDLGTLLDYTAEDLLEIGGFGKACLLEVEDYVGSSGYVLKRREPQPRMAGGKLSSRARSLPLPTIRNKMERAGYLSLESLLSRSVEDILSEGPPMYLTWWEKEVFADYLYKENLLPRTLHRDANELLLVLCSSPRVREALEAPRDARERLLARRDGTLRELKCRVLKMTASKKLHPMALMDWGSFASYQKAAVSGLGDTIRNSDVRRAPGSVLVGPELSKDSSVRLIGPGSFSGLIDLSLMCHCDEKELSSTSDDARRVMEALEGSTLSSDLQSLFDNAGFGRRDQAIFRSRYGPNRRSSLKAISGKYGVSRALIGRQQIQGAERLLKSFGELPLPKLRSALLFSEDALRAMEFYWRVPAFDSQTVHKVRERLTSMVPGVKPSAISPETPDIEALISFYAAAVHLNVLNIEAGNNSH